MMTNRKYQLLMSVYLVAFNGVVHDYVVKHSASRRVLSLLYFILPQEKGIYSNALDTSASQVR